MNFPVKKEPKLIILIDKFKVEIYKNKTARFSVPSKTII